MRRRFWPGVLVVGASATLLSCSSPAATAPAATVSTVTISGASQVLLVGGTLRLNASAADANGNPLSRTFTWVSATPTVAGVASDGTVTGISAGTATITATTDGISGSLGVTINNVAPVLGVLAPASVIAASGAFTLMAQGSGFIASSTVRWNGSDRPTTFVSATQLNAAIAASDVAAVGTAQVTVFTPAPGGGTSVAQTFTVSAPASNPVPSVTALSPSNASAGGVAFTLTVTGTNFINSSVVRWNGQARATTFVSATQLTTPITATDIAIAGTAQVTVFTPTPGGGASAAVPFVINPAAVIGLSPVLALAGGVPFTVTVTGTNFVASSVVQWNGQSRSTTFVNSTQLTAQITAADIAIAGTGLVTVQTPSSGTSAAQPIVIVGTSHMIAAGGGLGCGISSSGALYCWGDNRFGALGDGSNTLVHATPVPVGSGKTFTSVTLGLAGCGIVTGAALYCWGPGDGIANSTVPVRVAPSLSFASASRGALDVCGITTDGHTYCWGNNNYGQDGDGTTAVNAAPDLVSGGQTFVAVSTGTSQSCGLTASGAAWCWGRNESGELGRGDNIDSHVPVPVAGGHTFVTISAGNPSCAVDRSGAVFCWGDNSGGALGNGTTVSSMVPVAVAGGLVFTTISVDNPLYLAGGYVCGVTLAGAGYCWGPNVSGVLGSGQETSSLVPAPVAGGLTFSDISAGDGHACGVTTAAAAVCWGQRGFGYLGDGSTAYRTTPTAVAGGLTFTALSLGTTHMCGLTTSADVWCWGDGSDGELGNGGSTASPSPIKVSGNHHFTILGAGRGYTGCAVANDPPPLGTKTYCWGNNQVGDVGDGTLEPSDNVPVAVAGSLNFQSLSSGAVNAFTTTCGVTAAGAGYCWGNNVSGDVGDGFENNGPNSTPMPVAGSHTFASISAGYLHTCGITTGSAAYCWGQDPAGELGLGSFGLPDQLTPAAVIGGLSFAQLSAGYFATCAVTLSGDGYCWGEFLPTGSGIVTSASPTVIPGYKFMSIQLQGLFGCGLTTGSVTFCWGNNRVGQLGIGQVQAGIADQDIGTAVGGPLFSSIYVGNAAACGLANGQAFCWGDNSFGGLGIGEADHATQPVVVQSGGVLFRVSGRTMPVALKIVRR